MNEQKKESFVLNNRGLSIYFFSLSSMASCVLKGVLQKGGPLFVMEGMENSGFSFPVSVQLCYF